ncbi:uncharacterized protein HD556DRAFT_1449772 [Suillus plorans]|uniref:Uncharacterized protein n=1 Tax=Suillus plorans TaxID=116603 RepID=A0A9P7ACE5_9AGAM|nr:uncharacterized protein HD556DRAFT_1449772 [Suillus plorans]KAG1786395.1 hypothetical protein HD556DRAFT_1449772 [Suillus plorans]
MNPSCQLRQWAPQDISRLMKVKGTIQDVDGECSFKVSGLSRTCQIAPHYRIPLHALNKKFGLYKKIVAHLDASSHKNATYMRDMYLSTIDYMNNVRIAFLEDAAGSTDALCGDFRSPVLDYYLWLDHTTSGFHAECRQALKESHGVTFEGLQNSTCPDILKFLNWNAYHNNECKEHDYCGALQGCGSGEDIEQLLNAVDASLTDDPDPVEDPEGVTESIGAIDMDVVSTPIGTESNSVDMPSSKFPQFPLPFDRNLQRMSLQTLGDSARQILIGGFGRWLPSHIAMRFREIQGLDHNETLENLMENGLLITARNQEEFCEIFGMVEMMAKCQELSVDRGGMARFFTAVGRGLYTSHQGSKCSVEYGQHFPSSFAYMRSFVECEVQTEDCDILITVDAHDHSPDSGPRYEADIQSCNDHPHISSDDVCSFVECEVQTEDCDVPMKMDGPQNEVDIQIHDDHTHLSEEDVRSFVECEVQTDLDTQGESQTIHSNHPSDQGYPADLHQFDSAVISQHNEEFDLTYMDLTGFPEPPESSGEHCSDVVDSSTKLDLDRLHSIAHEENKVSNIDLSPGWQEINDQDTFQDVDLSTSPPLKSRLRERNTSRAPEIKRETRRMEQPDSKHSRPVVFATNRKAHRGKPKAVNQKLRSPQYTMKDLIRESQTEWTNDTPFIDAFLTDPQAYKFINSTIESDHESWLAIARHIAVLSMVMSIEFWFKDVATECRQAFTHDNQDVALSPLSHRVLVELSTRAMVDELSAHHVLQSILSSDNGKCANAILRYLLRSSQNHDNDPYAPGLRVLASAVMKHATIDRLA